MPALVHPVLRHLRCVARQGLAAIGAWSALSLSGGLSSAVAQVEIPDHFGDLLQIDAPDAATRIAECVGQPEPALARAWIDSVLGAADPDEGREYAPMQSRAIAITANSSWDACAAP